MKTLLKCSIIIATICVLFLTALEGFLLFSEININNQEKRELCHKNENYNNKTSNTKSESKTSDNNAFTKETTSLDNSRSLLDSIVYNVTLAVNSVNNVLTSSSIFIGILTLFVALVGLVGFFTLKEKIDTQFSHFSNVINKAEQLEDNVNQLFQSLFANYRYTKKSNDLLYDALEALAYQVSDTDIINQQLHGHHIINLYCPNIGIESDEELRKIKIKALNYLQDNAKKEDVSDLTYVAEFDNDPDIRLRAQKLIFRIENNSKSRHGYLDCIKKHWNCMKAKFMNTFLHGTTS